MPTTASTAKTLIQVGNICYIHFLSFGECWRFFFTLPPKLLDLFVVFSSSRFAYCICAICTALMFGEIWNCWANRIYLPQLPLCLIHLDHYIYSLFARTHGTRNTRYGNFPGNKIYVRVKVCCVKNCGQLCAGWMW